MRYSTPLMTCDLPHDHDHGSTAYRSCTSRLYNVEYGPTDETPRRQYHKGGSEPKRNGKAKHMDCGGHGYKQFIVVWYPLLLRVTLQPSTTLIRNLFPKLQHQRTLSATTLLAYQPELYAMATRSKDEPIGPHLFPQAHVARYAAINHLNILREKCVVLPRCMPDTRNFIVLRASIQALHQQVFKLVDMLKKMGVACLYDNVLSVCEETRVMCSELEAHLESLNLNPSSSSWRIARELSLAWTESGKALRQWLSYLLKATYEARHTIVSVRPQANSAQQMQPPLIHREIGSLSIPIMRQSNFSIQQASYCYPVLQSHPSGDGNSNSHSTAMDGSIQQHTVVANAAPRHYQRDHSNYGRDSSFPMSRSRSKPPKMEMRSQGSHRGRSFGFQASINLTCQRS